MTATAWQSRAIAATRPHPRSAATSGGTRWAATCRRSAIAAEGTCWAREATWSCTRSWLVVSAEASRDVAKSVAVAVDGSVVAVRSRSRRRVTEASWGLLLLFLLLLLLLLCTAAAMKCTRRGARLRLLRTTRGGALDRSRSPRPSAPPMSEVHAQWVAT